MVGHSGFKKSALEREIELWKRSENFRPLFNLFGIKRGFTLFELLVVLLIMSLMLAFAGTGIGPGLNNLRLKTATKKVAASLRYARNCATIKGEAYQILFDRKKNRLLASPQFSPNKEDADLEKNAKIYLFPPGVSLGKIIIENKEIETDTANIIFYPNGSALGGKVVVKGKSKDYEIEIDSITGVVKVVSG